MRFLHLFICLFLSLTIHSQSYLFSIKQKDTTEIVGVYNYKQPNSKEYWTITTTKDSVHLYQMNNRTLLVNQLSYTKPDKELLILAGATFSQSGEPILFWTNSEINKITSQKINLKEGTSVSQSFVFQYKNEFYLTIVNEHNRFGLLTIANDKNLLLFYDFVDGKPIMNEIHFESNHLPTENKSNLSLLKFFQNNPLEIIPSYGHIPLYQSVAKSKIYVLPDSMVLTFDLPSETKLIKIPFSNYTIESERFSIDSSIKNANSNSFFHENKLFQLVSNKDVLQLNFFDLSSQKDSKSISIQKNDTIKIANSKITVQSPDNRITYLNSTKKFLRRMANRPLGISVYQHKSGNLILTAGTVYPIRNTEDIIIGSSLGIGMIALGASTDPLDYLDFELGYQSVFFESIMDSNFNHLPVEQPNLYIDALSRFIQDENPESYSVVQNGDHYVLTYFSQKDQLLYFRKFSDSKILD